MPPVSGLVVAAAVGARELLAWCSYNPATNAVVNTVSAAGTDVDATNLVLPSFLAPASGAVLVNLTATGRGNPGDTNLFWCLREGSTEVTGSRAALNSLGSSDVRCVHTCIITGLTPGSAHVWKWGHAANYSTANAHTSYGGAALVTAGPAVMEVWSA